MLNYVQYVDLWQIEFVPLFNPNALPVMPQYDEYVVREIQKQDYIDLFTGAITYVRIVGATIGVADTINVAHLGCPGLINLIVGVYPYQAALAGAVNRHISYILIGEAPPPTTKQTFFYDVNHGCSSWIDAPCQAFNINIGLNKIHKLVALANKGVLLMDIYPFNINYTGWIRRHINLNQFIHILENQINLLQAFLLNIQFALVAVKITSQEIINYTNQRLVNGLMLNGIIINNIPYQINELTNNGNQPIDEFANWTNGIHQTNQVIHKGYHTIFPVILQPFQSPVNGYVVNRGITQVHMNKRIAVCNQGTFQPHPILLAFAFNL
jgi:hypothetical protein